MNIKAKLIGAAMGALGLCGLGSAALAASVTPPGERAGIDLATPLPEGLYFVDSGAVGNWRGAEGTSTFDYNVPIIAWATPWTIGAGRFQVGFALPEASISANNFLIGRNGYTLAARGMYNPFVFGMFAYNFGNGFSASYLAGAYIAVTGSNIVVGGGTGAAALPGGTVAIANPFDQTTFHQQLALAYHMNGWNATANLMYGIVGKNDSCNCYNAVFADYFNYDLALTHTFGKWEIGIVGYGSTDTNSPTYLYKRQSQFALGGLLGYNFGPVITQVVVGTDLTETNYAAKETRLGVHVIIPLWNPEAPKAVVAKY